MKKISLLCLLLLAGSFFCGELYAQQWIRSYRSARKLASSRNQKLFLFFSGSDWCQEGREMTHLFRSKAFLNRTRNKYVFYNADFPRHKVLGQEASEYNKRLANRYGITRFPTVVLADPRHGAMLAKHVGYQRISAEALLDKLEKNTPASRKPSSGQKAAGRK